MKVKELIAQTPEMSEEKLFKLIDKYIEMIPKDLRRRIIGIHHKKGGEAFPISNYILKEFDSIQDKKSYLTKSQRDSIQGFVGMCLIKMTKGEDITEESKEIKDEQ